MISSLTNACSRRASGCSRVARQVSTTSSFATLTRWIAWRAVLGVTEPIRKRDGFTGILKTLWCQRAAAKPCCSKSGWRDREILNASTATKTYCLGSAVWLHL